MSHSSATKLNRFRLQYSLRSLLVFVLLASVFMAWFGARYRAAREQRDAVAAIRALGANVLYDYEHRRIRHGGLGPLSPGPPSRRAPHRRGGCWGSTSSPTPPSFGVQTRWSRTASQVGSPMPPWGLPLTDASLGTIAELRSASTPGPWENPNDGERSGETWSAPASSGVESIRRRQAMPVWTASVDLRA